LALHFYLYQFNPINIIESKFINNQIILTHHLNGKCYLYSMILIIIIVTAIRVVLKVISIPFAILIAR
jgi:hypothetical protein